MLLREAPGSQGFNFELSQFVEEIAKVVKHIKTSKIKSRIFQAV